MNPTTNTEAGAVADVAAKLTEAQRAAIETLSRIPKSSKASVSSLLALCRKDLAKNGLSSLSKNTWSLTLLGLAVRQHLEPGATAGVAEMNEQMFGQGDNARQDEGTVV